MTPKKKGPALSSPLHDIFEKVHALLKDEGLDIVTCKHNSHRRVFTDGDILKNEAANFDFQVQWFNPDLY